MVESETPARLAEGPADAPRLAFTRGYPADAELSRLVAAFERGDYHTVRAQAGALSERTTSEEVRSAALDLRRRIEPDRMQMQLLALTFALLAFLTCWFYLHEH
jgi:hypothetical protein